MNLWLLAKEVEHMNRSKLKSISNDAQVASTTWLLQDITNICTQGKYLTN